MLVLSVTRPRRHYIKEADDHTDETVQLIPGVICELFVGLGEHPFVHLSQREWHLGRRVFAHLDVFTRYLKMGIVGVVSGSGAQTPADLGPDAGLTS